jgi:virginiamycin B lyase
VKLFALPKEFPYANLNTLTFDQNGVLWFTGQVGVYGRVLPASGKVEVWKAPKGFGPYGIATTPAGDVWYASLAGDHIAKIDVDSGAVTVVEPPRKGVGPRRIWSDSKGMLWVSLWNSGEVGRYDPAAKSWKTWQLPNSTRGCYSVYVDDRDKVWLTDFVANAIVRFDPASESFESFPSDKKGANVRQMLGRSGEAWGAESGTSRLVVVRD